MSKLILSEIFIYPIKSLAGISLQSSIIEERGLQYDRRWMLVDENNRYITQRTYPQMSLLKVEINSTGLIISHKNESVKNLLIPFDYNGIETTVQVWNDKCTAQTYSKEINNWFSEFLNINCKLVYMPDTSKRKVSSKHTDGNKIVGFADGYPFLIIGQSSLDLLNSKLKTPVLINRFRPNFVFTGGKPHEEDTWREIKIGNVIFKVVKPCARCVLTTVNQETGIKGKEPLATLSKYRNVGNKVLFGQNLICEEGTSIKVTDTIRILD